jgi:hypothetical protein
VVIDNAMVPLPGETAGDWRDDVGWEAAGVAAARDGGYPPDFDIGTYFVHDLTPRVAADLGDPRPGAE